MLGTMIYKMSFFLRVKNKLLKNMQKNQHSKEYVLELLQEGILILSSSIIKDEQGKDLEANN